MYEEKGFTLVELLAVIVIVTIIAIITLLSNYNYVINTQKNNVIEEDRRIYTDQKVDLEVKIILK